MAKITVSYSTAGSRPLVATRLPGLLGKGLYRAAFLTWRNLDEGTWSSLGAGCCFGFGQEGGARPQGS